MSWKVGNILSSGEHFCIHTLGVDSTVAKQLTGLGNEQDEAVAQ